MISTIGFIATDNKDVFPILSIVKNTIETYLNKKNGPPKNLLTYNSTTATIDPVMQHIIFRYYEDKTDNSQRQLYVFFNCDLDYYEVYKGKKIIFSLGDFGESKEIVLAIGHALRKYGDFHFNPSDTQDNWELYQQTHE